MRTEGDQAKAERQRAAKGGHRSAQLHQEAALSTTCRYPDATSAKKMADSFRSIAAAKRLAAQALEARFDHLTSGPPSPRKPKPQGLTAKERRDQDFRIACGAFVKGAQKAGAKLYADIQEAEKLLAAETARGGDQALRLLNSADGDGWTALHWAAAEGHLPMVRWLAVHKS